jgi:hypothetical protein
VRGRAFRRVGRREFAVFVYGFPKGFGLGRGEVDGNGLAFFFPGPLVVGTVGAPGSGMPGVGAHDRTLGDGALRNEVQLAQPGCEASVISS